ncbi:exodeoxyribonuclease VII large subunit [Paludibacterium paludis]|uniref:Exodeoxyribonuclease 7 large subunit n=1 Tax=Paludibacterium paludis TaxID=1225769 RepID=A0A918NX89_9NEIS|nr:exodeoxyribonuclease VII large subunit [Paludibacterium paludis]GGY02456.1 exodeoxyribonuclease 7 large subunit [Paludibacterium paludis]
MLFDASRDDVISVATLNRMARQLLEGGLPPTWISGEVSNLTLAASGHAYFSLKDGGAQIRCVMFRHRLSQAGFRPAEGMQLELRGTVTLYEARGDYQITVDTMRQAGLGRLYEAFEQLKARLAEQGLFDSAAKRPLPAHPRAIGVVTSPAAAALRDVITTLRRRMPSIPVILYPTPVQGEGAAQQVAAAIRLASERAETDVLIVCRGGGSIEDLWAFNEECVAWAIADSVIPVVTGVGHETDVTIADFVADRRAPTPTAAAELVSPDKAQLAAQLEQARRHLYRALARQLTDKSQHLDFLARRLSHPGERLRQQQERLRTARANLARLGRENIRRKQWSLDMAKTRLLGCEPGLAIPARRVQAARAALEHAMQSALADKSRHLARLDGMLGAMDPHAVLSRGYAIVENAVGRAIRAPAELADGETVTLRLAEGGTEAVVRHPSGTQADLPF